MKTYNILVFPCGTEIANEIIASLKYHKYFKLRFASSEPFSYCNFQTEEIDHLPYVNDEDFEKELFALVEKRNIDFIIPAHDDVAYALSAIEAIESKVIGQSREVNEIVRFKDRTYSYFTGILPLAKVFTSEEQLEFPLFVKPKRGQGSQDSFLIRDAGEFGRFKESFSAEEFVWMEYLDGEEYTVDCFSDHGELLYSGARTREKTIRGISVLSRYAEESSLQEEFAHYAEIISGRLQLHGLWFFQMKRDRRGVLKLLEVAPRVSGTMMVNRARGVNFVELAIYQKLGYAVDILPNDIQVSVGRALTPSYKSDIDYEHLYVDFDDTLLLEEKYINTDLMKLIFQAKNEGKEVYLITKNKKNNLAKTLHTFGISHIFDGILHIAETDRKVDFMKKKSLLVDDSYKERKEAIDTGFYSFGNDAIDLLAE